MSARTKLLPGQRGTKSLVAKYGESLLCIRYRYDKQNRTCLKTVELIVERKPWNPIAPRFANSTLVPVHIEFAEKALRELGENGTRENASGTFSTAKSRAPNWKST